MKAAGSIGALLRAQELAGAVRVDGNTIPYFGESVKHSLYLHE